LHPTVDALRIECATDDMIAYAGKIFYPATSDEDNTVLLEVMPFARDVRCDFDAIC